MWAALWGILGGIIEEVSMLMCKIAPTG